MARHDLPPCFFVCCFRPVQLARVGCNTENWELRSEICFVEGVSQLASIKQSTPPAFTLRAAPGLLGQQRCFTHHPIRPMPEEETACICLYLFGGKEVFSVFELDQQIVAGPTWLKFEVFFFSFETAAAQHVVRTCYTRAALRTTRPSPWARGVYSASCVNSATPRFTQCGVGLLLGILTASTKLDEWPVVVSTPFRDVSLYTGHV